MDLSQVVSKILEKVWEECEVCPRLQGASMSTIWLGSCLPDHIHSVFNSSARIIIT